jgi:hypothetical protein
MECEATKEDDDGTGHEKARSSLTLRPAASGQKKPSRRFEVG